MSIIYIEDMADTTGKPTIEILINGKDGGELIIDEAGFYNWLPPQPLHGLIPSWILQSLANKLNELNAEWQEEIERDIK